MYMYMFMYMYMYILMEIGAKLIKKRLSERKFKEEYNKRPSENSNNDTTYRRVVVITQLK